MEFKIVNAQGCKVIEVLDSLGDRLAIMDPVTYDIHPVDIWGRISSLRLERKVRRACMIVTIDS